MSKLKVNSEEFLKDLNQVIELVSKINNIEDITQKDLRKLTIKAKKIDKKIKSKYKNLDSEK